MPGTALFFSAYEPAKRRLEPKFGAAGVALSATLGDCCACLVRVPTEVLKQRMQVGQSASIVEALRHAVRESPLGLYRGFFAMISREIPFSGIQFPVYESVRKLTLGDRMTGKNSNIGSIALKIRSILVKLSFTSYFYTGSFSTVSTPIFASKYSSFSIYRVLQDVCILLHSSTLSN